MYSALRGRLPAKLVALFKIQDCGQDIMRLLAGIQMLSPVNSGRPSDIPSCYGSAERRCATVYIG